MPLPQYGAREGLADRLEKWVETLAKDKSYPWPGTGLIADLKTAAKVIEEFPDHGVRHTPTKLEFDL